jgi:hypothetical protein
LSFRLVLSLRILLIQTQLYLLKKGKGKKGGREGEREMREKEEKRGEGDEKRRGGMSFNLPFISYFPINLIIIKAIYFLRS